MREGEGEGEGGGGGGGREVERGVARINQTPSIHLCRLLSYAFCLSGPGAPAAP